ncbi:DUF6801 domain-containing protein [Amycolatopsis sp. SID8362]|uniref:DUF6801 domain-containing protein n=1 Tax=Amycolatopsis sp. SID8362 TaxID=2690346 RepID=UPI00136981AA|nr:DUF6801 domain-containing protein [Amycolatopsis sp. SID8362]NBH10178.1 hypothetical protein [Amycolatopsis sp. SID8362]NED46873.1 hypothetical protein [Amycolatopsis sp. SID8362]
MPRRVRPRTLTLSALAGVGLLSAVNGALTGVGSAAPAPAVPPDTKAATSVSVTCPFPDPAGARALTVETAATLPAQARTGTSLALGAFSAKLTLPRDVALSYLPAGATAGSLAGEVRLDLNVHKDDRADKVPVTLTVPATPLPEAGDVTLAATGTVPEIALNTVGAVTFDVTAPSLALAAVPPPAEPAAKPVACALDPEQQTTLGKVLVLPKVTPGAKAQQQAAAADEPAPGDPPTEDEFAVPLSLVTIQTKSTVRKLGATVTADPAFLFNGLFILNLVDGSSRVTGSTTFNPATATFLGFGFVPVTATVEFLPVDWRNSKIIEFAGKITTHADDNTYLDTTLQVMARLSNAKVNGVPLDLGPGCVTTKAVEITLSGPYEAFGVGHIRTDKDKGFELPMFTGCGAAGQDLNPLLSGMGSGTGNQAFVDTYNLIVCTDPDHTQCPDGSNGPPQGSAAAKKAAAKKPN